MNEQEAWVSLLQSIEETSIDLQRYPPEGDELDQVRQVERELEAIRWDCEDNQRQEVGSSVAIPPPLEFVPSKK